MSCRQCTDRTLALKDLIAGIEMERKANTDADELLAYVVLPALKEIADNHTEGTPK